MALITFTILYKHHHCLFPKLFITTVFYSTNFQRPGSYKLVTKIPHTLYSFSLKLKHRYVHFVLLIIIDFHTPTCLDYFEF